jgi:CRISPR type III-A-associated protein Csm2
MTDFDRKKITDDFYKFKNIIEKTTKKFTEDEVLRLSESLGKYIAGGKYKKDTTSQVSKFYHLVRIAEGLASSGKDADKSEAKIKLHVLKAQAFYAQARNSISKEFKEFFDVSLERILKNTTEIKDFLIFFETVYAYFYYEIKN